MVVVTQYDLFYGKNTLIFTYLGERRTSGQPQQTLVGRLGESSLLGRFQRKIYLFILSRLGGENGVEGKNI